MKAKIDKINIEDPPILSPNLFPVVGIGASAGGLEAFKKLLRAIPEDSGMAFVLVQHLDPKHESMLPELLQKVTNIPVMEIADDIKVNPNHIYVIPSNKMMVATDGVLLLSDRPPKSKTERNLPIDLFFTSLAEVHQSHAIGVVLSGTASDGTLGLKAIKDNGGITFAQDEASAAYDGMPHSAAKAGVVDFILPPEKIPEKLLEVTKIFIRNGGDVQHIPQQEEDVFKQIISLLRIRKGTDFTYYKQSTIRRRILRRMVINKNEETASYLKYLRDNKTEQNVLYQDLLIPVTDFFRDPKTFDHLCDTVFPLIVNNKSNSDEPIRLWVAGCSTGEEAYSLAICMKEYLGDNQRNLQIFATDLSEPAIAKARQGIYSKNELNGLTPERLNTFFSKNNGGYQVNKNIRDLCVFALHNFLKDPPFGKMDFISCRNVLIYMEPYLQKKALTTFHYSLNPTGYLLLGKSETTGSVPELFTAAIKNDKLYTRKDVRGRFIQVATQKSEHNFSISNTNPNSENIRTDFQKTADDIMLRKYTPAGVVVNEAMEIVHFRGNTSNFLEQSSGKPTHNLLQMAKNGLAFELRNILHKVKKEGGTVIKENIPLEINGIMCNISIEALPLPNTIEPHYLVLFHNNSSTGNNPVKNSIRISSKKDERDAGIKQLELELLQTREDMRSITEDQEAANEELQSANEELLSSSEELQSLNEELETGKEELQSTNEELIVVNQEMIGLNEQLTTAKEYAEAIIENIHEPLLVLDQKLRIKNANNAFYKTFRVNEPETEGVLIYDIGNKQWNIPELRTLLEKILPEKSVFNDFEVKHTFSHIGERVMLLNAREVINKNSPEKLILLSIGDITERKKAQEVLDKSGDHFRHLVKELPAAVYSCDAKGQINFYNDAAVKIWGREPEIGKDLWCGSFKMYKPDGTPLPPENSPMAIALKEGRAITGEEIIIERPDGCRSIVRVYPQPEFGLSGEITGAINMGFDVTEQVTARKKMEAQAAMVENMLLTAPAFICTLTGPEHIYDLVNERYQALFGSRQIKGKPIMEALPELEGQQFDTLLNSVYNTGEPFVGIEVPISMSKDVGRAPELQYFNFTYQPMYDENRKINAIMVFGYDVTKQVIAKKLIEESESQFRQMAELMPQKIWTSDAKGNKTYFNKTLLDFLGYSFAELKGPGWEKVIHSDDREKNKEQWQHCLRTGADYKAENRLLRKDGKYLWHLTRAVAIKDEHGKIKMWIGSKTEIQEQLEQREVLEKSVSKRTNELQLANKELEQKNEELALTKEKLLTEYSRSLIEASLDPLVTINTAGKITDINQATVNITGLSRENLTGTQFFDYFTEPKKAREVYEAVFSKGLIVNALLTLRHINGTTTEVLLNGSVYKDDKEKVLGVVIVARDITEQKRTETELKEAKIFAELATEIAEVAKSKAEYSAQLAKDAMMAKQQFLSNMSHEIRTPMNAIIGFTKVIFKTELSSKQKEYLNAIKMSGDSLIVLINDILDLAKVDAGKMTFEQTPFKMEFSLATIIHLFEPKIQEKNLVIVKEYDKKIPEVLVGDPVRLHQIILNLLSNAVKFTTNGKIIVSARLLNENEEKAVIELAVKDTGIGIPASKIEKIFENFQQASAGTSRMYGGTGLGLAIVKQLVEAQGGQIQVKSKENEGSTFSFEMAFKKTTTLTMIKEETIELDTEIKNIKVLVVEDIALNQLLMKTLLDDFGFESALAGNGKIAIELMKKNSFDIILMDLQMPEMNGFEATDYIRNTMHSNIPIIALTADVTTVDLAKCREFGMNDYIAKPVDEKLLYKKIEGLVMKPILKNERFETPAVSSEKIKYTDLTYLHLRTKSNKTLMMEMIALYLKQTPVLIAEMKQALQNLDWNLLQSAAHKMIPSFSIIGMDVAFENMAKKIQEFAKDETQTDKMADLVNQLETVCSLGCFELQQELNNLKNDNK